MFVATLIVGRIALLGAAGKRKCVRNKNIERIEKMSSLGGGTSLLAEVTPHQ